MAGGPGWAQSKQGQTGGQRKMPVRRATRGTERTTTSTFSGTARCEGKDSAQQGTGSRRIRLRSGWCPHQQDRPCAHKDTEFATGRTWGRRCSSGMNKSSLSAGRECRSRNRHLQARVTVGAGRDCDKAAAMMPSITPTPAAPSPVRTIGKRSMMLPPFRIGIWEITEMARRGR